MSEQDKKQSTENEESPKQENETTAPDTAAEQVTDEEDLQEMPETNSVQVEKVELGDLLPNENPEKETVKMDVLMNLSLNVSIELGRTEMLIKDILKLGIGSIIELNKLAGEPVDILVNNKKFAEGEVVVIEENFGVRITNLASSTSEMETINQVMAETN